MGRVRVGGVFIWGGERERVGERERERAERQLDGGAKCVCKRNGSNIGDQHHGNPGSDSSPEPSEANTRCGVRYFYGGTHDWKRATICLFPLTHTHSLSLYLSPSLPPTHQHCPHYSHRLTPELAACKSSRISRQTPPRHQPQVTGSHCTQPRSHGAGRWRGTWTRPQSLS